jgi:ribosomal protein L2
MGSPFSAMPKKIATRKQRRGRNPGRYNAPSHRFRTDVKYIQDYKKHEGVVEELLQDPGRTAPLASVKIDEKELGFKPSAI